MLQIILTILIYLILVIPVGIYVYHIAAGKHTFADPVFDRVDGVIYKADCIYLVFDRLKGKGRVYAGCNKSYHYV